MATFGYTSIGGTQGSIGDKRVIATEFTASAGEVTKLTAYVVSPALGFPFDTPAGSFQAAVFNSSKQTITNGVSGIVSSVDPAGWYDFTFSSNPTLSAVDVYLGVSQNGGGNGGSFWYDSGDTGQSFEEASGQNNYNPIDDVTSSTDIDRKYSIYATYEASGDPDPDPITKVKVAGTFVPIAPKVKLSGTFVEKTPQIKQGGSFS